MKKIILIGFFIFFLFLGSSSWAKTLYVADSLQITMRSLPENKSRIVRMLSVYEPLEDLGESRNGWLRVRSGNREGWVLERFTSSEFPKNLQLEALQKKYALLVAKSENLPELVAENEKLRNEQGQDKARITTLTKQYEALRNDAADTVRLKKEIGQLKKENEELLTSLEKVKLDHSLLKSNAMLHWFLAGAGVFALAWFLGFILGRIQRKKKSRLY